MKASGCTPRQRGIVILVMLVVVIVFALPTGFSIIAHQSTGSAPLATLPTLPESTPPPSSASPPPASSTAVREVGIWLQVEVGVLSHRPYN